MQGAWAPGKEQSTGKDFCIRGDTEVAEQAMGFGNGVLKGNQDRPKISSQDNYLNIRQHQGLAI